MKAILLDPHPTLATRVKRFVLTGVILSCLLSVEVRATPIPAGMTNQDVNTLVALEATQNTLTLLAFGLNQPVPMQTLGTWVGIINATGWSLGFSGSLNSVPLSITQSGLLDTANGLATWTESGLLGSEALIGSGQILFDPSWFQTIVRGLSFATIGGVQALLTIPAGGLNIAINVMASALEIEIVGKIIDDAFEVKTKQIKNTQTKTALLSSTGAGGGGGDATDPFMITQVGFQDLTTGETSFSTRVIPEPGTMFLIVSGLFGLIGFGRKEQPRQLRTQVPH